MEMTITAKIQIYPTNEQSEHLNRTLSQIIEALNYISNFVYTNNCYKQKELNDKTYYYLRENFSLKSQMAQSCMKTVLAKYKSAKSNGHKLSLVEFNNPEYDLVWNRDYSINKDVFSINSLNGRLKIPYEIKGMEKYFDGSYSFGTAKLVKNKSKYYLHIPATKDYPNCEIPNINNIVGIDLGLNFIATTYDSQGNTKFFNGKPIKHFRGRYKELRKRLQEKQTPSSRKRLKSIGKRENRYITDVNHQITKALVDLYGSNTLFVLEDLSGVRNATEKVRIKDRYVSVSWAYYQFQQMLEYKASLVGSKVIYVDPRYTSQMCPKCGHIEKTNRDKKNHMFCCKNCNYKSNDDRIGAMNLWRKGIEYIEQSQLQAETTES